MPLHSAFEFLLRMRPDLADEGPERDAPVMEPFPLGRLYWGRKAQEGGTVAGRRRESLAELERRERGEP